MRIDVTGGVTTRTVSLLDAALHNFAKTETVLADSQYITNPMFAGTSMSFRSITK